MGKTSLCGNQTSFLQISLFEIGATVAQLVASVRLFDPPDEPRYHCHDLAVSGTLNTIICSLTLFDIQISSYLQLNKSSCSNCNGDICIYPKYTYLQF